MALTKAKPRPMTSPEQLEADEQEHARDRKPERQEIARAAQADERHRDGGGEFDRGDRGERQPVDRQIEAHIHGGQNDAQQQDQAARRGRRFGEGPPGLRQTAKMSGGRGDPQPGDAQGRQLGEKQHGERGSEIVEDGADQEIDMRAEAGLVSVFMPRRMPRPGRF